MHERQPTLSRPRLFGCAVLAVLALLMGCRAVAAADTEAHPTRAGSSAQIGSSARIGSSAQTGTPASAWSDASASTDTGGPACAPTGPGRGGTPAVPARAWGEHAQVPLGRAAPEETGPPAAVPVRTLVRGPDRPAPDRLELCVMRV
ncbi:MULTISPECIES: hypothetical protein [unclassified Streptomyces]|uniref:hypothetical protein n=1 Tax=unclassified Streptomyces TaxID=2593676 RepID=UPI00131B2E59|nr:MULTISPECIES: hypothetical protein [unclassified Streptomyces]